MPALGFPRQADATAFDLSPTPFPSPRPPCPPPVPTHYLTIRVTPVLQKSISRAPSLPHLIARPSERQLTLARYCDCLLADFRDERCGLLFSGIPKLAGCRGKRDRRRSSGSSRPSNTLEPAAGRPGDVRAGHHPIHPIARAAIPPNGL